MLAPLYLGRTENIVCRWGVGLEMMTGRAVRAFHLFCFLNEDEMKSPIRGVERKGCDRREDV